MKIKELKSDLGVLRDFELSVGRIIEETWSEEAGSTSYPSLTDLREWDLKLLQRYKPFYMPFCDVCCLCTFGKCDLTGDKRGACGLDMATQQSRIVLLACCIGTATHVAHARHLLGHLTKNFGREHPIMVGGINVRLRLR